MYGSHEALAAEAFLYGVLVQFLVPTLALTFSTPIWMAQRFGPTILAALRKISFSAVYLAEAAVIAASTTTVVCLPGANLTVTISTNASSSTLQRNIGIAVLLVLLMLGAATLALVALVGVELAAFQRFPRVKHDFALVQMSGLLKSGQASRMPQAGHHLARQTDAPREETTSHSDADNVKAVLAFSSSVRRVEPPDEVAKPMQEDGYSSPDDLIPEADASQSDWLEELAKSNHAVIEQPLPNIGLTLGKPCPHGSVGRDSRRHIVNFGCLSGADDEASMRRTLNVGGSASERSRGCVVVRVVQAAVKAQKMPFGPQFPALGILARQPQSCA